jgi:preprotein translocase subunit Sec63
MDVVSPVQVKKAWMKVLVNIHPDKVQQKGGTTAQRFVADKVFHTMLEAYNGFAQKEL